MPKKQKVALLTGVENGRSPSLGEFAHHIIGEQYQRIVKQEQKVLADNDPEHLHQMRVGMRRLRTALRIFDPVVELPRAANARRLRNLARVLGELRDLDVQIKTLKDDYHPQLDKAEQKLLDAGLGVLRKQRRKAFAGVEGTLARPQYSNLKTAYETWLEHPRFKPLSQLPLIPCLPDLLSPLLSTLLLHPGWLIQDDQISPGNSSTLHDLRKVLKQVRYQTEFFAPFYGEGFESWIGEVRLLQDQLGQVQDGQVLLDLLSEKLPATSDMPQLQANVQQRQSNALKTWEITRQKYLSPDFRHHLHQLVLEAIAPSQS